MYFYYGITHSSLENPAEEIELTIDQSYVTPQVSVSTTKYNVNTTKMFV